MPWWGYVSAAGVLGALMVFVYPLWCMLKRFWGWRRYRTGPSLR